MERTFSIAPTSSASLVAIAAIGVLLLLIIGLLAFSGYSSRNVKFEMSDQGLSIGPALYGRFIPKDEIMKEGIQIINLNTTSAYKPRIRTNGVGLPGYAEGWFKLSSGEKALLFVTDRSRVVYIPTTKGYSVMLSASQPDEFYEAAKQWK